ncbi:MAG: hypothetical protein RR954_08970, partial [Christensenellaceae bacterium]
YEKDRVFDCTPIGASIIGWDNGIHYCFIRGFDEIVFTVNPDTCCDYYVYPIAKNFNDFLRLILASKNTNVLQQIILWDKEDYISFTNSPDEMTYYSQQSVIDTLAAIQGLGISPMEQPFEYVKSIQNGFDYSKILFSDSYYDTTGREKPSFNEEDRGTVHLS